MQKNGKASKRGSEILEHWYTLIPGHHFSTTEVYDGIEREIAAQKLPALKMSRVDMAEGGVLSDNRVYLRMKREKLIFDVCAAPVGVNYFFSYRFYEEPGLTPFDIACAFVLLGLIFAIGANYLGFTWGSLIVFVLCATLAQRAKLAVGRGLQDIDTKLVEVPIIGPIYENLLRKDTYYRQDVRIAYCSIVSGIVKDIVEKTTAAKGVELIREFTHSPGIGDLYAAKQTSVKQEATAAA
jgi:hypothetical protein